MGKEIPKKYTEKELKATDKDVLQQIAQGLNVEGFEGMQIKGLVTAILAAQGPDEAEEAPVADDQPINETAPEAPATDPEPSQSGAQNTAPRPDRLRRRSMSFLTNTPKS